MIIFWALLTGHKQKLNWTFGNDTVQGLFKKGVR